MSVTMAGLQEVAARVMASAETMIMASETMKVMENPFSTPDEKSKAFYNYTAIVATAAITFTASELLGEEHLVQIAEESEELDDIVRKVMSEQN